MLTVRENTSIWFLNSLNSLTIELFEFWTLRFLNSLKFELYSVHCNISLSYVWIQGVILFELIVSDNFKLNGRNYFRFSFCHLCEGIVCSLRDTRYNIVNVVKSEWSNLPLPTGSVKVMSKTLQVRLSLHVCIEQIWFLQM